VCYRVKLNNNNNNNNNSIYKAPKALASEALKCFNVLLCHKYWTETFAPFTHCITDHILCQAIPDIHCFSLSTSLTFYLVEHFSPNYVVNWAQIWTVGSHRSAKITADVFHFRRLIASQAQCVEAPLFRWKIKNSPEISHATGSSCSVSST